MSRLSFSANNTNRTRTGLEAMPPPSRNTVGVYDRPHPLRTRKVVLPVLIAVVVVIGYAVYFLLR